MKKGQIIIITIICFFSFLFASGIGAFIYYDKNLKAVDLNSTDKIEFIVSPGSSFTQIISSLKSSGLIKDELSLKIYSKLNPGIAQAGRYMLSKSMSAKEIYNMIINGKVTNDTIWIQFVEGKRLTYIANQIALNFDYTEEEVMQILDDKEYIKELIDKYDILTDDILNEKIYHPLEGYLFPDTYEFLSTVSIKEIIEKMILTTQIKLSAYSSDIESSGKSIHELLTLASIVELEGARSDDRNGVAGVFCNRLASGWTLGSDVTTYYAVNKDFSKDLTWSELNSCNGYNTRGTCVKGLPVGPIASPSLESIKATINSTKHNYYYFVADKYGKTYFSKTEYEHNKTISELRSKGLWYTYN